MSAYPLGQYTCKLAGYPPVEVVEINAISVRFVFRGCTFRRSRRGFLKNYRPARKEKGAA